MTCPTTPAPSARAEPVLPTLVADDEAIARRQLRSLLAAHPDIVVVGEAVDGRAVVEAAAALRPRLVLLDVEMPELGGVAAATALAAGETGPARTGADGRGAESPAIVFTTAHERYAVAAFEVAAVDYLLKPFGARRLALALDRVRAHLAARVGARDAARPAGVVAGLPPSHLRSGHLLVPSGRRLVPVAAADIVRLEADDDYVHVHAAGAQHLVTARLGALVAQLAPWPIVRVHRSHAVNLAHVAALVPRPDARLEVRLRDGARVAASRSGTRLLRGWDSRRPRSDA